MNFGNPWMLWALLIVPVLVGLCVAARRKRATAMQNLGDPELLERLYPESVRLWRRGRERWGIIAVTLLIVASSRPQYGRIEQTIRRSGVDMLIALDTSASMLAKDVQPNRLEKARECLKWLLRRSQGNRVGIIAFAGDAFLNCPMTLDHSLAELVLESLDTTSIGVGGTDLGRAIKAATGAFERGGGSGTPVLVLITDGEDNEGLGLEAAQEAAKAGLIIHAIGIGTETGAPVPDAEAGYKESSEGTKVNSRMDIAALEAIAEATGGAAYAAGSNPIPAVEAIAHRIGVLEKSDLESRRIVIYQDRYEWFLAPAIVLLLWILISRPEKNQIPAVTIERRVIGRDKYEAA